MRTDEYRTIASVSEGLFKDRGSKFLAFAYPVKDEEMVKEYLKQLRKEHHSARHHCYAFRIGFDDPYYRVNDDGEPSGTAGKPIYGQILSHELTQILIVVVRYFGGTLLGTSGLINAYRAAAEDCLKNAREVQHIRCREAEIIFRYDQMNSVMRIIQDEALEILEKNFTSHCRMKLNIRQGEFDKVMGRLNKIPDISLIT